MTTLTAMHADYLELIAEAAKAGEIGDPLIRPTIEEVPNPRKRGLMDPWSDTISVLLAVEIDRRVKFRLPPLPEDRRLIADGTDMEVCGIKNEQGTGDDIGQNCLADDDLLAALMFPDGAEDFAGDYLTVRRGWPDLTGHFKFDYSDLGFEVRSDGVWCSFLVEASA